VKGQAVVCSEEIAITLSHSSAITGADEESWFQYPLPGISWESWYPRIGEELVSSYDAVETEPAFKSAISPLILALNDAAFTAAETVDKMLTNWHRATDPDGTLEDNPMIQQTLAAVGPSQLSKTGKLEAIMTVRSIVSLLRPAGGVKQRFYWYMP
jgi:hypothetical protein